MTQSYSRFYAALGHLPACGDRQELKDSLVATHTDGRTTHLSEMTEGEYDRLCGSLEARVRLTEAHRIYRQNLKKKRRIALCLLQDYGIDTTSWEAINTFCLQPKIAGKDFAHLKIAELDTLAKKMRAILNKKLHTQPINQ